MAVVLPISYKVDNRSLKNAERGFKDFGHSIKGVLGGLGAAFAVGSVVSLAKESVKAAAEDIKSQRLLERQLKTTTHATKAQISTNEKWLSSLSLAVGIVDDKLRPALANAVRGTGSLAKGQKILQIALDGAAATGKPLNTVMQALIKATNGQTTSLYRLAPELKKSKGGLDAFALSVKGAAKLAADPFDRFKVATDELKEKFGKLLLPMVTQFVDYLTQKVVPAVSSFLDQVGNPKTDAGKMFTDIKDAVHTAFKDVSDFFALFGEGNAIKGFGNVAKSLASMLPALVAFKGILMLASAGNAITNLVKAVRVIMGGQAATQAGQVSANLPFVVKAAAAGQVGAEVATTYARGELKKKTGKTFTLVSGTSEGVMALPGNVFDFGKKRPVAKSAPKAEAQTPTIIINSYGSTNHEFENLVIKAFQKHARLNGSPTK